MRYLLCTVALVFLAGCRSQTTAMTNPFLPPDRVPAPATRTLLPGTAQPYYQGDPVPTSPAIATPPVGIAPGTAYPTTTPTFTPQPAGTVPPNGWNTPTQPIPQVSPSSNVLPGGIQPTSAIMPATGQSQIQVPQDQQSLRFAQPAPLYQSAVVPAVAPQPPTPSNMPAPQLQPVAYPNQFASFESQPQFATQPAIAVGPSREVRIRPITSDQANKLSNAGPRTRDGFRPQGSSRVRKPELGSQLSPRQRPSSNQPNSRFGHDPKYQWLRGQLLLSPTGAWSLLYASPDSPTDALGGNLPIANPQVLGNLKPGDFVQLRGRVATATGGPTTPPAYQVSVVQLQRI